MWWLEQKTVPKNQTYKGILPTRVLTPLTGGLFILFVWGLFPLYVWGAILPAALMARLLAFDLRYHILPDIYVFPLLVLAYFLTETSFLTYILNLTIGLAFGLFLTFLATLFKQKITGLGGGDIKLMATLSVWLGWVNFPLALALACVFTLPLSCIKPKSPLPFGPGLVFSLFIFLIWKNEIQHLILSFSAPTY